MKFIKIKTKALIPPKDDIYIVLDKIKNIKDGDVLLITSKVLSIHQGRCVKISPKVNKLDLIKKETGNLVILDHLAMGNFYLTIKNDVLAFSAGIDESNANGYYVLLPKNINRLLKEIRAYLINKFKIKRLGLIATDSHSYPLRRGTLGISVGFFGIQPQKNYIGKPDIFGRALKYTKTNIVDALAAIAVHLMGEGNERVPIIIVRGADVQFTNKATYQKI